MLLRASFTTPTVLTHEMLQKQISGADRLDTLFVAETGANVAPPLFTGHALSTTHIRPTLRLTDQLDFITVVLLASAILTVFTRFLFRRRLRLVISSFITHRFFNQLMREGQSFNDSFSLVMSINFYVVFSLLLYLAGQQLLCGHVLFEAGFSSYIKILGLFIVWVLAKKLLHRFASHLFESYAETAEYISLMDVFNQVTGIGLLVMLGFVSFAPDIFRPTLFYLTLLLVCTTYIYRFGRLYFQSSQYARFSQFHLFLYLCTFEILPVALIIKVIVLLG